MAKFRKRRPRRKMTYQDRVEQQMYASIVDARLGYVIDPEFYNEKVKEGYQNDNISNKGQ